MCMEVDKVAHQPVAREPDYSEEETGHSIPDQQQGEVVVATILMPRIGMGSCVSCFSLIMIPIQPTL